MHDSQTPTNPCSHMVSRTVESLCDHPLCDTGMTGQGAEPLHKEKPRYSCGKPVRGRRCTLACHIGRGPTQGICCLVFIRLGSCSPGILFAWVCLVPGCFSPGCVRIACLLFAWVSFTWCVFAHGFPPPPGLFSPVSVSPGYGRISFLTQDPARTVAKSLGTGQTPKTKMGLQT